MLGCEKCDHGFVFTRCCFGLAEMCGCGGMPVQATNCKNCNPENKEPDDAETESLLEYVEWVD